MPRFFSRRLLNPYRGVLQVVEAEEATAHSHDGLTWYLRADDGYGWARPTGVWSASRGLQAGAGRQSAALIEALEQQPNLPFPMADSLEYWLLDKETGLPLALLDSLLPSQAPGAPGDSQWYPFVVSFTGYRSAALAAAGVTAEPASAHRDHLARQVSLASRPLPATQWFQRCGDGGGEGRDGTRLAPDWRGRALPAHAFPELLVRAAWNTPLEQSVISDYHAFLAAALLPWPGLSDATRAWLEVRACERPRALEKVYRLLPASLDPDSLRAALVAARLEHAAEAEDEYH
jgi:hypothetical protein